MLARDRVLLVSGTGKGGCQGGNIADLEEPTIVGSRRDFPQQGLVSVVAEGNRVDIDELAAEQLNLWEDFVDLLVWETIRKQPHSFAEALGRVPQQRARQSKAGGDVRAGAQCAWRGGEVVCNSVASTTWPHTYDRSP